MYGGYMGLPFANVYRRTLQTARYLAARGAQGLTCGGVYTSGPEGLRNYAALRVAWESRLTPQGIVRCFCDALYGRTSGAMQAYYRRWKGFCTEAGLHSALVTWAIWADETFAVPRKDLEKAEALVPPGTPESARIEDQSLCLDFAEAFIALQRGQLAYYREETPEHQAYTPLHARYLKLYRQLAQRGMVSLNQGVLDSYAPEKLSSIRATVSIKRTPAPPGSGPLAHSDPAWVRYALPLAGGGTFVDEHLPLLSHHPGLHDL
ncbi:MAG: hypothetical protein IT210_14805 [Armatimonadetes bacterium]|nr:hypothetical protein [Armatimonadota bacterium]